MGEKDSLTKKFMSRPDVFADAFNYLMYEGRPVIKPENLREMDTASLALPRGASVQKMRDVLKCLVAKSDDEAAYIILGVENQTDIHYAMPVRNMLYDAIQYENQIRQRENSEKKTRSKRTGGEYLSCFGREDRLKPVVTLVIYWGEKEWDGPTDIHGMFGETEGHILDFVPNYKINLIAPATISKERLTHAQSEFRQAMWFIRCSTDSELFEREILHDPEYEDIDSDTVRLLNSPTKIKLTIQEGEERVNMCVALQQIIDEGREEGMTIGRQEGREEERAKNIAATIRLLRSFGIGENDIADKTREQFGLSSEEIAAYMAGSE